jgi:hypothetical protein
MFAWSSLSRASHFSSAGMTSLRVEPAEIAQPGCFLGEHLRREHDGALVGEPPPQHLGCELVRARVVDGPDHAVAVEEAHIPGREVQRHVGRVRPVEQPRRQAVVLPESEPVPHRIHGHLIARRVLAEVPQQLALEAAGVPAEPHQARAQILARVVPATEGERGAMAP